MTWKITEPKEASRLALWYPWRSFPVKSTRALRGAFSGPEAIEYDMVLTPCRALYREIWKMKHKRRVWLGEITV